MCLVLQGIEGDRWQPPDLPNNEVLIRPQPVDEEQEPDQQVQEDLLHEQSQGMEAAQAAVAPSPVKVEQDVDRSEDDTRPSERSGLAVQLLLKLVTSLLPCCTNVPSPRPDTCRNSVLARSWLCNCLLLQGWLVLSAYHWQQHCLSVYGHNW